MLAAIKMEVMTPSVESPDEGCIGWPLSIAKDFSSLFIIIFMITSYTSWWFGVYLFQLLISTCLQYALQLLGLGDQRKQHLWFQSSYLTLFRGTISHFFAILLWHIAICSWYSSSKCGCQLSVKQYFECQWSVWDGFLTLNLEKRGFSYEPSQ